MIRRRNSPTSALNGGEPNGKMSSTGSTVMWLWKSLKPVILASSCPTVIFPTAGGPNTQTKCMRRRVAEQPPEHDVFSARRHPGLEHVALVLEAQRLLLQLLEEL